METTMEIRNIASLAEMREVEEMQKSVWGIPDMDVVPYSHLVAAVTSGGSLIGAFDGNKLAGFVYGFPSFEKGQLAHHSHMLAVYPEYRSHKLGERLKRAQREFVLKQGVSIMSWTFDPLQSLNAYFNFNKLGVVSDTYFVDFYGDDAPSFLHQNSTDRLWVIWNLKDETTVKPSGGIDLENLRRLVTVSEGDVLLADDLTGNFADEQIGIEIPEDINLLQEKDIDLASRWRKATRTAFTRAFEQGYIATGFYRMDRGVQKHGVYLLGLK